MHLRKGSGFLNIGSAFFKSSVNHMVLVKYRVEVAIDRFDDEWVNGLSGIEILYRMSVVWMLIPIFWMCCRQKKQHMAIRKGLCISLMRKNVMLDGVLVDWPLMLNEEVSQFLFLFFRTLLKINKLSWFLPPPLYRFKNVNFLFGSL